MDIRLALDPCPDIADMEKKLRETQIEASTQSEVVRKLRADFEAAVAARDAAKPNSPKEAHELKTKVVELKRELEEESDYLDSINVAIANQLKAIRGRKYAMEREASRAIARAAHAGQLEDRVYNLLDRALMEYVELRTWRREGEPPHAEPLSNELRKRIIQGDMLREAAHAFHALKEESIRKAMEAVNG